MTDRTVRVVLDAVTQAYESKMARAGVTTKGVAGSMDDLGKRGSDSLNRLSGGLVDVTGKTAAVAGGIGLAAAAVLAFANTGIDAFTRLADQVDTYQDITGASAEESSRMVAVANTLGVSTDALAGGMFRLSRNVKTNADELKRFGVEAARNEDGSIDLNETLLRVADAYNRVGGGAQGNALAMAAFGRGGAQLIDILERSRVELEGFWAEAERNQQILSDEDLETARKYEIAMRELQMAWQGLAISAAEVLLPVLIDVADALTTIIQKVNEAKDGPLGDAIGAFLKTLPVGQFVGALDAVTGGSDETTDSTKKLAEGIEEVDETAEKAAADGLAAYSEALDDTMQKTFGAGEANDKIRGTLARLAEDVRTAKEAGDDWATSLDSSNTTGLANREMLRSLAAGAGEVAEAMVAAGEDPTAAMQTLYVQLLNTVEGLGFNRTEASELLNVLLQFPSTIGVGIDLDISRAEAALARLMRLIADAPLGIDALEAEKWVARHGTASAFTGDQGSILPTITPSFGSRGSGPKGPTQDDLERDEDERWRRMWEFGGVTNDEYEAYLQRRLGSTARFTEEDERLQGQLEQMRTTIGQGWLDAAEQMQALEDAGWEVLRRQHELGEISTATFLEQLERRLAGLDEYSDEYMETWREINQLRDEITADELAIIEAVDEQRRYDMAFADIAYQRALSDLRMTPVAPSPVVVRGGTSYSYSASVTGSGDTYRDLRAANERMRDDAFLRG